MMVLLQAGRYAGELREFPRHLAEALLADGRAVLPPETAPETADAAPPETAMVRTGGKKGRGR